jgi:pyruvate,water dikinase
LCEESLREEIALRRNRWSDLQRLSLPEVIDAGQLDNLGQSCTVDAARSAAKLAGTGLSPGAVDGSAYVALSPDHLGQLPSECILVCPSTDPGWTPLFLSARGLVMERGGVLSHGAIVARDFGIPAVVCAGATQAIRSGDRIRVDGSRGNVHILEKAG